MCTSSLQSLREGLSFGLSNPTPILTPADNPVWVFEPIPGVVVSESTTRSNSDNPFQNIPVIVVFESTISWISHIQVRVAQVMAEELLGFLEIFQVRFSNWGF